MRTSTIYAKATIHGGVRDVRTLIGAAALAIGLAGAANAASLSFRGSFAEGDLATIEFTLGAGGTYLELTTDGSYETGTPDRADTVIALFAGTGPGARRVGFDDDDGDLLLSRLRFGDLESDGDVPASGTYTLVIGAIGASIKVPTVADIGGRGTAPVDFVLTVISDATLAQGAVGEIVAVPLPAGGALLAGAALALGLRRRTR